jgi:ATP-dependent NAD(P)H-hydrate dehydratase
MEDACEEALSYRFVLLDTSYEPGSNLNLPDPSKADAYDAEIDALVGRVTSVFHRLHVLVVGPGLSRDKALLDSAKKIIAKAKEHGMPIVIDAVGLASVALSSGLQSDATSRVVFASF